MVIFLARLRVCPGYRSVIVPLNHPGMPFCVGSTVHVDTNERTTCRDAIGEGTIPFLREAKGLFSPELSKSWMPSIDRLQMAADACRA